MPPLSDALLCPAPRTVPLPAQTSSAGAALPGFPHPSVVRLPHCHSSGLRRVEIILYRVRYFVAISWVRGGAPLSMSAKARASDAPWTVPGERYPSLLPGPSSLPASEGLSPGLRVHVSSRAMPSQHLELSGWMLHGRVDGQTDGLCACPRVRVMGVVRKFCYRSDF